MANIKSAKKRILVSRANAERNKAIKSGVKTSIKKVYAAIEANDKEAAVAAYSVASKYLDKGVVDGICNKNYANRQKSRLSKAINNIA